MGKETYGNPNVPAFVHPKVETHTEGDICSKYTSKLNT